MGNYDKLLEPIAIGGVSLRNRFVMLPMTIEKVDNYHVSDDLVDFYEQRAKGGVALVEIGSCYVSDCFGTTPKYHTTTGACGAWSDEFIPGFKRIADSCHEHGAKVAAQLQLCYEWRASGDEPLLSCAPSVDVMSGPFVGMPEHELTVDEIKIIVSQYGQAARRCKEAGIDIIEIHAGIGYMVMRFLSKYSNHRTDEYGGDERGRAKFLTDIIDEIHRTCGKGMPIIVRISADDLMPDGNRIEDTLKIIPIVEEHGVDAWSVQAGFHEAPRPVANALVPEGEFIGLAKSVKTVTDLPVFPGTRITGLEMCKKVIEEGYGDLVGMGRSFIADPEIPNKVAAGTPEKVRACIVCSRCLDNIFIGKPCQCSVNANVMHSGLGLPENHPANQIKHLVIVGAGPAGLEAARVASLRGHRVTIVDHSDRIGGLLNMAQVLNDKVENYVTYWQAEFDSLKNVTVMLKTEATLELLKSLNPDEVFVAPGGSVIDLDFPGRKSKYVVSSQDIKDMVAGKVPEGKGLLWRAAVKAIKAQGGTVGFMRMGLNMAAGPTAVIGKRLLVVGGGFAGLETAAAMCSNREVTVIDTAKKLGNGIGIIDKNPELRKLKKLGVRLLPLTELVEVSNKGIVTLRNVETGEVEELEVDTVLLSLGVQANTDFFNNIKEWFPEAKLLGDATTPSGKVYRTLEAIEGGFIQAMAI
ncbi:FAD-dependent oxidoreductase [Berryella wangjianweii]|uniref:FAD-dependent oxidoreductase n=1 Tax=Berryella wangjianweii TaxID=2734634 RepID=A0A6M8J8P1_9ACTN|nr:FAD-dependent oxidoreductase [Berryella wangjianweii]QKF07838.1 FAD-dependent oxidoreductase [Berryella wangjianweii]